MSKPESRFYELGPFTLDTAERCLILSGEAVPLTPKLFALLMEFVQSEGGTLSKDDLAKAVWPDTIVTDAALAKNISRLKRILRDGDRQRYIETLSGRGYRFIAQVRAVSDQRVNLATQPGRDSGIEAVESPGIQGGVSTALGSQFGGHLWHVLACSSLYAGLYVVALFIEGAYQFDRFGRTLVMLSPFIFLWALATSVGGLWIGGRFAVNKKAYLGLLSSVSIFVGAAAIVYATVCRVLPSAPITEALTQAQTAQGAYLKDIYYSLVLAVLFVIPPFCFVVRMQRELQAGRYASAFELLSGSKFGVAPSGTVYPRLRMLGLALMIMASLSVYLTANLLDHIAPSRYMNLFTSLIYLRLIIYYGLGVLCLAWYNRALNDLKRECVAARASG